MAYQRCVNDVIYFLKNKYPIKVWNETPNDKMIIFKTLLYNLGSRIMCFDNEIIRKTHNEIYKGLTINNYIVPLMDIDIDPSLREVHEYNKDYDECVAEEENNTFKFNLS